ncbi:TPA: nucleotidyl transferase AbiEii/AbiGii toxin family protein [Enterococcus faecium]|nr:nucleotidyl transferase AbiEii/AbiGii toxin family protein [Enterococcus faecium]
MTPTQLKAKVKNISREKEVDPQLVLRHFMMEKFLEKISESPYRENFVLKGGFLIGSKYGIENRTIPLESYPTEQIIAEKLSATFDFLTDNSRGKDFYDLYTIPKMEKIDEKTLKDSVRNTFTRRGKTDPLKIYYEKDMDVLKNSHELKDTWKKYQKSNPYAASITYEETMDSISNLMEKVIHVEEKERKIAYQRHQQMNREMER